MKILIAGASGGIGRFLAGQLSKSHEVFGTYYTKSSDARDNYNMFRIGSIQPVQ